MRIPIFSGMGVFFCRLSREAPAKGAFINKSPMICLGCYRSFSEKLRKRGYDFLFHDPSIAPPPPEKGGIVPLLHRISIVGPQEGSGKIVKYAHILFPEPEEKKRNKEKGNRGHHNVPEIWGQFRKSSLERG